RIAPSTSPRFENRHVQGSAGSQGQERILRNPDESGRGLPQLRDHLAPMWILNLTLAPLAHLPASEKPDYKLQAGSCPVPDAARHETAPPGPRPRGGACPDFCQPVR